MSAYLRYLVLLGVKALSRSFYSFDVEWVGARPDHPFRSVRMMLLLNHTSLFEPIFLATLPNSLLWDVAKRGVMPGADSTLKRPVVGRFYKALLPRAVSISRKRDRTWKIFLRLIEKRSLVLMAPEGRMKRLNGLDKYGKKMTVRAGIAEMLESMPEGKLILAYSCGLHHIQAPGERIPRFFKRAKIRYEALRIEDYKARIKREQGVFRKRVVRDLERRRDLHCRWDGVPAARKSRRR